MISIILNVVGTKKEVVTSQTSSLFATTATSSVLSTTETSSSLKESTEPANIGGEFAIDWRALPVGNILATTYQQTPLQLTQDKAGNLRLRALNQASKTVDSDDYWDVFFKSKTTDTTDIKVLDSGHLKTVHVNTMLENISSKTEASASKKLFETVLQASSEPVYAYYKSSGNIALAFQSLASQNYFFLEFYPTN